MFFLKLFSLFRPLISLAVGICACFGAFWAGGSSLDMVLSFFCTVCLCAGCSALNQLQESETDALMSRTDSRVLVQGHLSHNIVLFFIVILILFSLFLFWYAGGFRLFLAGVAIIFIYNFCYTPLKTVSNLSLLIGSMAGSMPVLAGWLAAGGNILDMRIIFAVTVFYLWQIPHFYLMAENYKSDYIQAGIPLLTFELPSNICTLILCIWIFAYFICLSCIIGLVIVSSYSIIFIFMLMLVAIVCMLALFRLPLYHNFVSVAMRSSLILAAVLIVSHKS